MTVNKEKSKMLALIADIEKAGDAVITAIKAGKPIIGHLENLKQAIVRKADRSAGAVKEAEKKLAIVNSPWRTGKDPVMVANKIKLVVSLATKPYKRAVHA
jgi:hypothetical protein